jgi:hypothetical protein
MKKYFRTWYIPIILIILYGQILFRSLGRGGCSCSWTRVIQDIHIRSCREFHELSEYTIALIKMLIDTNDMLKIQSLTIFFQGDIS